MPGYKLIVKNAKVILKTVTNSVLNITGIRDLLTGTGSIDSNNKIDWTLQEYTNTAANFTTNNPILLLGQKGIETDDLLTAPKFKIGDGVTAWNTLPYANSGGSSSGVQSVTGSNVDNTDPANPVVNTPTLQEVITESPTIDGVLAQSLDGNANFAVNDGLVQFNTLTQGVSLTDTDFTWNGVKIATGTDYTEQFTYTGSTYTLTVEPIFIYSIRTTTMTLDETDSNDVTIVGTTLTVTNPAFEAGEKLYIKYKG